MVIALTALVTVVTFVVSHFILRIAIEPIQEQRRIIGRITHVIAIYRGIATDDGSENQHPERVEAVRKMLRDLAGELRSTLSVIPFYSAFSSIRLVLPVKTVQQVALQLMKWELFMSVKTANASAIEIAKLLGINHVKDEWAEFQEMIGVANPVASANAEGNGNILPPNFPQTATSVEAWVANGQRT